MKKNVIEVSSLRRDYVNDEVVTQVLKGVSFHIAHGEFVAIMGPSGSGKSTLMHILGFLDRATGGAYLFEGKNVSDFSDEQLAELRNKKIGFIFQSFNLLPRTSVLSNVELPLIYTKMAARQRKDKAEEAIKSVGLMHRINHFSNQLSGGEQQRVAIARALVNEPAVIFADEPTGNLDSKSGQQIMEILENLNDQGKTIIIVTHEQDTAKHAKRIIKIRDGQIVSDENVNDRLLAKNGTLEKIKGY